MGNKIAAVVLSAVLALDWAAVPVWAAQNPDTGVSEQEISGENVSGRELYGGYIADRFSEKTDSTDTAVQEDNDGLLKASAQSIPSSYRTEKLPAVRNQGAYGTCWALSSNREFAHAGPFPLALHVYAMDGAEALQIEEQPVALAITMRSPKSCVTSFIYGVSPHPPHAPENSMSGRAN